MQAKQVRGEPRLCFWRRPERFPVDNIQKELIEAAIIAHALLH